MWIYYQVYGEILNGYMSDILSPANFVFSGEFPTNHLETSSELPLSYTFSDLISSVGQRRRRQAKTDMNRGNYEAEYDYDDFKRGTSKVDPSKASQRNCRCFPSRQPPMGRRSSSSEPWRRIGYIGYEGGYGRGNGYVPRNRGSSWWFDERDDYADDILVYRFYNGRNRPSFIEIGNLPRRTEYRVQKRSFNSEYQRGISVAGRISEDRDSTFQYQGGRQVGSDNYRSNTSTLMSQGWRPIVNGTGRTQTIESGYSGVNSEHGSESELTEYESGVNSRSSRKTEIILFLTTTPRPPTPSGYNMGDCCYHRGFEERRRAGNKERGTCHRPHRHTTTTTTTTTTTRKPAHFFGISWSRLLDSSSFTDEVDSDSRSMYLVKKKDRMVTVR